MTTLSLAFYRVTMEGERLLNGGDTVTDDLLHLVADHIIKSNEYNFTDGPVNLPDREYWLSSRMNFQVISRVD